MNHLLTDIFGETAECTAQREANYRKLQGVTKALDDFFERQELASESGHKTADDDLTELRNEIFGEPSNPVGGPFTKSSSRVDDARDRFLRSVDRFIAQARSDYALAK